MNDREQFMIECPPRRQVHHTAIANGAAAEINTRRRPAGQTRGYSTKFRRIVTGTM